MRVKQGSWAAVLVASAVLVSGSAIPLLRTGPLSGRIIVIDPGHGGPRDSGAIGPSGLREAHVNLQVSLRLADLLKRQGAKVTLTRTTDAPLVPDTPEDPTADLRARAAVANDAGADLFISIHHNDTTATNDPRNDTQVYWKLDDNGPSRDFGQILLPKLAESLQLPRQRLIPGNFAVLRHSRRPAILGEGAYLSNPLSEARLKRPETWQKEAEAYASAVVAYFARGVPRLGTAKWQDESLQIDVSTDGHPITDVKLWVDDLPVPATFDPARNLLRWQPDQPLANGIHEFRAEARNRSGNAAFPLESTFRVARPPAALTVRALPPTWQPDVSVHTFLAGIVTDALGQPVADGTDVSFRLGDRSVSATTRNGQASAYLPWPAGGPTQALVTAGEVQASFPFVGSDAQAHLIVNVSGWGADLPAATAWLKGKPIERIDGEGRLALTVDPGAHDLEVQAPGYRPWRWSFAAEPGNLLQVNAPLEALHDGVFLGKSIVLDPLTSEQQPETGQQTMGLARLLRDRLVAAGARVSLTRPDDEAPELADRVRLASRVGADLYLGLGPGGGVAAHYYTSPNGIRLAKLVSAQLNGFRPSPEASYLLSHTPCPALILRAPLGTPAGVSNGVFEALRRYFTPIAGNG